MLKCRHFPLNTKMLKLITVCVFLHLFYMPYAGKNESEKTERKTDAAIITEIIQKVSSCPKTLKMKDIGIFEIETFYKNGDIVLSAMISKGKERSKTKPLKAIQMGENNMLPAIESAILGMCPGEYRKITVPSEHAYGDVTLQLPDGRRIKPPVTVISHVKLLQILRTTGQELKEALQMWDSNNDGNIDKSELKLLLNLYSKIVEDGDDDNIEKEIDDWFTGMDKNNDNVLDLRVGFLGLDHDGSFAKKASHMLQTLLHKYSSVLQPMVNTFERRRSDEL